MRGLRFFYSRLPERMTEWFFVVPIRKVPLTRCAVNEEEVVLPVLELRLLFNHRHEALPIVKTIWTNIPGITRGLLNGMNQSEGPTCVR